VPFSPAKRFKQFLIIIDSMDLKDLFGPGNAVGEEERTTFILITNSNWNASQVDMKSGTERTWENDSQIEMPLL